MLFLEPNLPFRSKWEFHQGIVPLNEDYFDYNPLETKTASGFVVLTKENVSRFEFKNFKVNTPTHTHTQKTIYQLLDIILKSPGMKQNDGLFVREESPVMD